MRVARVDDVPPVREYIRFVMANGGLSLFVFWSVLANVACSSTSPPRPDSQDDAIVRSECNGRCNSQNETNSHGELICNAECKVKQCIRGCTLWNEALSSNCSRVCDNFNANYITPSKLYCIAGCNDAITLYFQKIQTEIGSLPTPSLVPDSLADTTLRLQWKGVRRNNFQYKVQWKLESNPSNWQYCQKETWTNNSIIQLDDLRPYTNYQVLSI